MRILHTTTAAAFALSLISVQLVDRFLVGRIALLGSFAGLELSHNPGIAFGLRLPPIIQELLIGIALVIVAVIAFRSTQKDRSGGSRTSATTLVAFGLILGGGLANIIDRIPDGLVTDFIQIGIFPTFNIADSCITVGATLLLWESWKQRRVL
jgi:signal peptidase II